MRPVAGLRDGMARARLTQDRRQANCDGAGGTIC